MGDKRIKRALTIADIKKKKFKTFDLAYEWKNHIGNPEQNGVWFVWGNSGHGKSRFLMNLAKELSHHQKVAYNALEEGARYSIQKNIVESGIQEEHAIMILDREPLVELKERLRKRKAPKVVFIDSLQYTGMTKKQYIELKEEFKETLFIFNSHAEGKEPLGNIAKFVRYDADVKIRVEGFKAFPMSRMGGGDAYIIWEDGANKYWVDLK